MITNAIYNFVTKTLDKENIRSFMKTSLKVAATISIFAISIFTLSNIPKASAGPITYRSCLAGCAAIAPGPFKIACFVACLPMLAPNLP